MEDTNESTPASQEYEKGASEYADYKEEKEVKFEKESNQSDYDSTGSYSEDEEPEENSEDESGEEDEAENVRSQRQEGDGEETTQLKKVDHDEDKKNPQYIPKRGTFYEHDDRTLDDEDAENGEQEKEKDVKKKIWEDKKERWTHDRFNGNDQAPKSKTELVEIYGYDIRNEDGPPRARRRRRYGRGPNKYTRNWEDEDAYANKAPPSRPKRIQRPPRQNQEEFPPLIEDNKEAQQQSSSSQNEKPKVSVEMPRPTVEKIEVPEAQNFKKKNRYSRDPDRDHDTTIPEPRQNVRPQPTKIIKPKKEIVDSDYKGFTTKTRLNRNVRGGGQRDGPTRPPRNNDFIHSQNFVSKNHHNSIQEVETGMGKMSVQDNVRGPPKGGNMGQRQGGMPPRMQNETKGSKRYSSIRQRSLPETPNPPPIIQHSNYYANDFNQAPPQALMHQTAALHQPPLQAPALAPMAQVPVTAGTILQASAQYGPPFGQAPTAFIPTAVPAPAFIPTQTPQLINYVQSPPQFTQTYQGFQPQFNAVTQPTELYQAQGVTYYSTDHQVGQQRSMPLKRPKAAIPIVAPPAYEPKKSIHEEEGGRPEYIGECEQN